MFRPVDVYDEEEPRFGFGAPAQPGGEDSLIAVKTQLGWARPRWTASGSLMLDGEDFSLPLNRFDHRTLEPVFGRAFAKAPPAHELDSLWDGARAIPAVETGLGRAVPILAPNGELKLEIGGQARPLHHFDSSGLRVVEAPEVRERPTPPITTLEQPHRFDWMHATPDEDGGRVTRPLAIARGTSELGNGPAAVTYERRGDKMGARPELSHALWTGEARPRALVEDAEARVALLSDYRRLPPGVPEVVRGARQTRADIERAVQRARHAPNQILGSAPGKPPSQAKDISRTSVAQPTSSVPRRAQPKLAAIKTDQGMAEVRRDPDGQNRLYSLSTGKPLTGFRSVKPVYTRPSDAPPKRTATSGPQGAADWAADHSGLGLGSGYSYVDPNDSVAGGRGRWLDGRTANKCNIFAYDALKAAGVAPGKVEGVVPVAKHWGNPRTPIDNYRPVAKGAPLQPGDVLSDGKHVALYTPLVAGGVTVPMSTSAAAPGGVGGTYGRVVQNDWGFRPGQAKAIVAWRYDPSHRVAETNEQRSTVKRLEQSPWAQAKIGTIPQPTPPR